jgi:4-hydroxy-2-oxoglutarate aldolase
MMNLTGIYPPIPTPFNDDESVAYDQFAANLEQWLSWPLTGVVMPGSNSEAAHLTRDERLALWRICGQAAAATGKQFIAGTGADTTAETIALTEAAAKAGAVATLLLPPYFYKGAMSHEVLLAHYRAVADASPIPILVYNVPAFTGVDFAVPTLLALAEHPRIVGMKDSSANVVKVATVLAARPDFQVLSGSASALLAFLSLGAVGGIMALANIAAEPLHQLMMAWENGRFTQARQIQLSLVNLNSAITARYGVPGLKYALDRIGLYGGPARRPLLPLKAEAQAEIDQLLESVTSNQ